MATSVTLGADRLWFTSDTHFWHHTAAKHRGAPDPATMTERLIEEWNKKVRLGDTVVHLGDFSFAGTAKTIDVIDSLNGDIILVKGNHDKGLNGKTLAFFKSVHDLLTVKVQGDPLLGDNVQRIVCCHFPMLAWDMHHHGAWHLHGHSHGTCRYPYPDAKIMDVGVDCHERFAPFSYHEIAATMAERKIRSSDYHQEKSSAAD